MNLQTTEHSSVPPNGKLPNSDLTDGEVPESQVAEPFISSGKKAGGVAGSKGIIIFVAAAGLIVFVLGLVALSTTKSKKHATNDPHKVNLGQQGPTSEPKQITPTDQLAPEHQSDDDAVSADDISRTKNSLRALGDQLLRKTNTAAGAGATSQPSALVDEAGADRSAPAGGQKPSALIGGARENRSGPRGTTDRATPSGKPLATIPPFQPPAINTQSPQWTPQPYTGQPYIGQASAGQPYAAQPYGTAVQQGSAQEIIRLAKEEVTKPSMIFTLKRQQAVAQAAGGPAVTNFGLEPGFHVAVRLEANASTAISAPVTAVVEYNYQRNGEILIPAGSRAIGKLDGGDRNGNVSMSFNTIDLPDGTPIPISAVALDSNLRTIKGVVTGSNRGKGIIVGTLSGIGQAAAMMVGQSSSSMTGAYSEADMMRDRLAQNTGQMGDTQISRLIANERIVVTVPAGTELYMVFTKPAVANKSAANTASAASPANPMLPSGIGGRPMFGAAAPPLGSQ